METASGEVSDLKGQNKEHLEEHIKDQFFSRSILAQATPKSVPKICPFLQRVLVNFLKKETFKDNINYLGKNIKQLIKFAHIYKYKDFKFIFNYVLFKNLFNIINKRKTGISYSRCYGIHSCMIPLARNLNVVQVFTIP